MATSGIEDSAMRLLGAFYDLSGGKLNEPVSLGTPDAPPTESAAKVAGIDLGSTEVDVVVRYLLNQGYIHETDTPGAYTITAPGIDKAREVRGV